MKSFQDSKEPATRARQRASSETARIQMLPKGGRRKKMEKKGTVCSCQLRALPPKELCITTENVNLK